MRPAASFAIALTFIIPARAHAQAATATVPVPVLDAFHHTYPAAKILASRKEKDRGRTVYEIESRDGTTRRDLLYASDGSLVEVEETMPSEQLPKAVRAAALGASAGGQIVRAERVVRATVVTYEIRVRKHGRVRSFTFDESGHRP